MNAYNQRSPKEDPFIQSSSEESSTPPVAPVDLVKRVAELEEQLRRAGQVAAPPDYATDAGHSVGKG